MMMQNATKDGIGTRCCVKTTNCFSKTIARNIFVESATIKDPYFVGTMKQARDFKKTTSGFIHGYRYNARTLHRKCGALSCIQ